MQTDCPVTTNIEGNIKFGYTALITTDANAACAGVISGLLNNYQIAKYANSDSTNNDDWTSIELDTTVSGNTVRIEIIASKLGMENNPLYIINHFQLAQLNNNV